MKGEVVEPSPGVMRTCLRTDGRGASQSWAALVCMAVLAGLVILAGALVANAGDWWMREHDAAHSGTADEGGEAAAGGDANMRLVADRIDINIADKRDKVLISSNMNGDEINRR